jgi:transposase
MVLVDGQGVPLGVLLASASPSEVKLAEATLERAGVLEDPTEDAPFELREEVRQDQADTPLPLSVADRAYDSDPLRERLEDRGVQLVAPHRKNRTKPPTQVEAGLEPYKRRWTVERTFAWLGNFRRLLVRHDRFLSSYRGFFHIACFLITLRFLK